MQRKTLNVRFMSLHVFPICWVLQLMLETDEKIASLSNAREETLSPSCL